ncbi:iron chelate uptake ABC transporter family permease subunit [Gracilibacillus salitolerans]|uniref:Iron chelate uptake ABC transporter family permease subunit n=1 Tax=Gracilibacillus salitolerans TaxID=2663022 RepID=A0A5Q2TLJ7_9BACI|nr:iron ABC transporter permease [Gracilibacillus salitolerans]QGH34148.1 iron chelate uptake ABC transporter family permease subunit [Gracilibacillus salitolerans]
MSKQSYIGRTVLTFGGGTVLLLLLLFIHMNQGSVSIAPSTIFNAIFMPEDQLEHHTVRYLRMPRAIIGILAGGALAVSGVLLQTITKNPLASASTLGIHSGSYFAVVFASVFISAASGWSGLLVAFLGGMITAVLVYTLAGVANANPVKMVLAGMVITMMFSAFTSLLQIFFENETAGLFLWGSGTLVQNNWEGVQFSLPFITIGLIGSLLIAKSLDLFQLGEEVATGLGQKVQRTRIITVLLAVFLASVTVSVVGPIGFVGLIAPHLIKLLGFQKHYVVILGSFLWGAVVLLGADVLARVLDPTFSELPVGAITAFIGAPWLIWLIMNKQNKKYGSKDTGILAGSINSLAMQKWIIPILSVFAISIVFVGISTGNNGIQLVQTFQAIFLNNDEFTKNMALDLRLPRLLVAATSGVLLAISGYIFQGVLRNPLADPSVIGITSGAGVGALTFLYIGSISAVWVPLGAFIGALIAFLVVMLLAYRAEFQPALLALLGIGISAFGSAVIQIIVVRSDMAVASALTWLSGTTYAKTWTELTYYLVGPLIILVPIVYLVSDRIHTLALGDDTAKGLGLSVLKTRFYLALLASVVAAASVATVGTIGFVGLIAPHVARLLLGPAHKHLFFTTALLGGVILMVADVLSRTLLVPKEIPSGIIVAIIGAPYFLWLMNRSNKWKM